MRLPKEQIIFIKTSIKNILPVSKIYLFGSRVYDDKKGGDIDILVLSDRLLNSEEKRKIKISFHKKFGEQKIDIVSFCFNDNDSFKQLILTEAIEL